MLINCLEHALLRVLFRTRVDLKKPTQKKQKKTPKKTTPECFFWRGGGSEEKFLLIPFKMVYLYE